MELLLLNILNLGVSCSSRLVCLGYNTWILFKLNVSEYPDSWNVYDSLGEAYFKKGDKAMAIKNYQKAVELNPRESGREKQNYANQVEILRKLRDDKQD